LRKELRQEAEEALIERDRLRATEVRVVLFYTRIIICMWLIHVHIAVRLFIRIIVPPTHATIIKPHHTFSQAQARRELSRLRAQRSDNPHAAIPTTDPHPFTAAAATAVTAVCVEGKAQLLARYERREAELKQLAAEAAAAKSEAMRCQREQRSSAALYSELCAVVKGEGEGHREMEGLRRRVSQLEGEKERAEARMGRLQRELKRVRDHPLAKEEQQREVKRGLEERLHVVEAEAAEWREREGKWERRVGKERREVKTLRAQVEEGEGRWRGKLDALRAEHRGEVRGGVWLGGCRACLVERDRHG
jgi:hypothetical protein